MTLSASTSVKIQTLLTFWARFHLEVGIATEHMAAESPEVVKGMHLQIIYSQYLSNGGTVPPGWLQMDYSQVTFYTKLSSQQPHVGGLYQHLHQLKFKHYSPGPEVILNWVATEHMAAERPEVAKVACT